MKKHKDKNMLEGREVVRQAKKMVASMPAKEVLLIALLANGSTADELHIPLAGRRLRYAQAATLLAAWKWVEWSHKQRCSRKNVQIRAVKRNAASMALFQDMKIAASKEEFVESHPDLADTVKTVAAKCHRQALKLRPCVREGVGPVDPYKMTERRIESLAKRLRFERQDALAAEVMQVATKYKALRKSQ